MLAVAVTQTLQWYEYRGLLTCTSELLVFGPLAVASPSRLQLGGCAVTKKQGQMVKIWSNKSWNHMISYGGGSHQDCASWSQGHPLWQTRSLGNGWRFWFWMVEFKGKFVMRRKPQKTFISLWDNVLYKHGGVQLMVRKKQREDEELSVLRTLHWLTVQHGVYFDICTHFYVCVAHRPSLYSSGLYPRCLTSVATPSACFPCQLGHVSGHRDLYLNKHIRK